MAPGPSALFLMDKRTESLSSSGLRLRDGFVRAAAVPSEHVGRRRGHERADQGRCFWIAFEQRAESDPLPVAPNLHFRGKCPERALTICAGDQERDGRRQPGHLNRCRGWLELRVLQRGSRAVDQFGEVAAFDLRAQEIAEYVADHVCRAAAGLLARALGEVLAAAAGQRRHDRKAATGIERVHGELEYLDHRRVAVAYMRLCIQRFE